MLQDVSGKFCRKHASCLQWNILQSAPPWSNSFPHTGPQQIFFEVQSWAPDFLRRFPLALVLVLLTSHLAGHHSTRVFTLQAVGSIPTQLPWILPWSPCWTNSMQMVMPLLMKRNLFQHVRHRKIHRTQWHWMDLRICAMRRPLIPRWICSPSSSVAHRNLNFSPPPHSKSRFYKPPPFQSALCPS